jgi:hypothetical protein
MGTVRSLPTPVTGVRLADAVKVFLDTIPAANTRRGYGIVLNRLVKDFGADTNVALLEREPDRVSGWFAFVWVPGQPRRSTSGWRRFGRRASTGVSRNG